MLFRSHPLSSPSPALNLSQHQGLFQRVSSSHQVAKSIGSSASASVLPMNIQGLFPLRLTGLIFLLSKELSKVFSSTPQFQSMNPLALSLLYGPTVTSIHNYWKNYSFDIQAFVGKMTSLLFNMLSRFVIAFLPRSKSLLIS